MKTPVWLILIIVAFAAGVFSGKRWGDQQTRMVIESAPPAGVPQETRSEAETMAVPGYAQAVAERDWDSLIDLLESASFENRKEEHAQLYAGMRSVATDLAAEGAFGEVARLLSGFAELNPQDYEVRFQLAEALEADGRFTQALAPIFEILQAPLTVEVRERAEARRDALVEAEVQRLQSSDPEQLAQTDGNADRDALLVTFFESLVQREPVNDQHRAALARAQMAAGAFEDASQTLDAMAGYGVDSAEIDALRSDIAQQLTGVNLREQDRGLYASANASGQGLNLLLDTGATQTALTPATLASIEAVRLGRSVQVRTAGGMVQAPVYRVADFEFGGTRFEALEVIALASLPPGSDGLLGMDVLREVGEVAIQQ